MNAPAFPTVCRICGEPIAEAGAGPSRRVLKVGRRVPWSTRPPGVVRHALLFPHQRCEANLARYVVSRARKVAPLADLAPVFAAALDRVSKART